MTPARCLALTLALALLPACAAIPVTPGAEKVKITSTEPQGCEQLGDVVGTQGNAVSGGFTSNETLITGARNDLRNKAWAMGANVVFILSNTTGVAGGQHGGSTTSSHLMGVAYKCPTK
jgi:hypothetical protein